MRAIANGVQIWPAESVNERPPLRFSREPGVGPGHAAQQTLRGYPRQRIGRRRQAQAIGVGQRRDRIERRGRARQAGEVGLVAELAAKNRAVDHVAVVDHGVDHRHILLVAGVAEVIDRARVEEAAIADAGQIKLRDRLGRQVEERLQRIAILRQPVVGHEGVIGQQHAFPAPGPFVVQRELALGIDAAAELAVAGLAAIGRRVELVDAIGTDLVGAVDQALTEFALQQHALPGHEARRESGVIVRRDRPVERGLDTEAIAGRCAVGRHQKAGLALHGRIGRREIRQIRHRHAEELELGVLEVQHLLGLVVDDAGTLDLPQRRLLRIVLAGRAGGINAVFEHGVIAAGAVGAGRGHPRRIRRVDA